MDDLVITITLLIEGVPCVWYWYDTDTLLITFNLLIFLGYYQCRRISMSSV